MGPCQSKKFVELRNALLGSPGRNDPALFNQTIADQGHSGVGAYAFVVSLFYGNGLSEGDPQLDELLALEIALDEGDGRKPL